MANPSTGAEVSHLEETRYVYDQLEPNTIRIFELWPPSVSEPHTLHGRLLTEKLSSRPPYEALSYAWGLKKSDDKIHLQTGQLGITPNLAAALRQLQTKDLHQRQRLWVDAICINQTCEQEKSAQVALMAQIYENSQGVLAWLGQGTVETEATMMALKSLAGSLKDGGLNLEYNIRPSDELSRRINSLGRRLPDVNPNHLGIFLAQDWFQRLWIVQEVALPCQVTLLNGNTALEFMSFTAAISALEVLFHKQQYLAAAIQNASDLAAMRMATQSQKGPYKIEPSKLLELVIPNAHKKCSDPRDLIFGLLGLYKVKTISFEADYSLDVLSIYRNFALAYLSQNDLTPLHYAGKLSHRSHNMEWPTWVPDWECNADRRHARMGHRRRGKPFYTCTGKSASIHVKENGLDGIGIVGRSIDMVEFELSSHKLGPADSIEELLQDPDKIFELRDIYTGSAYATDREADKAFARTLCIDGFESLTRLGVNRIPSTEDILKLWHQDKRESQRRRLGRLGNYPKATSYISEARKIGRGRNFFTTKSGYMGLGPVPLRRGDVVAVFNGAETPFILREVDSKASQEGTQEPGLGGQDIVRKEWALIGDCYLHDFMDNEVLTKGYDEETFWIR